MKKKTKEEKKGTPVFRTAKGILKLLQNKVIASLMLLGQGVLFLVSPSGDMQPTIRISAGLIIFVALILIFLHLRHPLKRNALDIAVAVFNGLLIPPAIFCMISPQTVEPFVRFALGIVTIVTGLLNLNGETHLFVSLRCMRICDDRYRLYAGGGILSQSDEEMEWNETAAKMQAMLSLIKHDN